MQARSNGTKRPAMLDYEADCNKSVSETVLLVLLCSLHMCTVCVAAYIFVDVFICLIFGLLLYGIKIFIL